MKHHTSTDHIEDDRVKVEFFTNERSIKGRLQVYFVKNQRSSLRIRIFNLLIKLLSCILYIVRVGTDEPDAGDGDGYDRMDSMSNLTTGTTAGAATDSSYFHHNCNNSKSLDQDQDKNIHWDHIWWVNRNIWLWGIQVFVAFISLSETLLVTYLGYKGNILQQVVSPGFILEAINTVPFIVTIFFPSIRTLFVPVFLNCWLAKTALDNMLNDLHRAMQKSQSALAQQLLILSATFICLIFTSVCGIQHLQRGSCKKFSMFNSLWFVIVTFSTVGYGDICPDIWPSKLFMMVLIGAAFIVLPRQFEQLAYTWMERQKMGGTYSSHRAQNEKHVVVVATVLHADTIMDFLNEFYAHPKLQLSMLDLSHDIKPSAGLQMIGLTKIQSESNERSDSTVKLVLQVPIWAARVIYIQGSALKDTDLGRCRMQDAEACFMIAARNYADKTAADQHTILRSWAVKDFAPHCPQYIQIFRPESKLHVQFAEHVVCEDEFKYALLANNCLCPGVSTLMTLLLHTSRGAPPVKSFEPPSMNSSYLEGQESSEDWTRLYGRCSGNEIYHILLGDSRFFGEYAGKSFTYASFHAHRKYGVTLVGIRKDLPSSTIQLNPGPRHIMRTTDTCFYMSVTKEENSEFILAHPNEDKEGLFSRHGSIKALARVGTHRYTKVTSIVATVGSGGTDQPSTQKTGHYEAPLIDKSQAPPQTTPTNNTLSIPSMSKRPSIELVPATLDIHPTSTGGDGQDNAEMSPVMGERGRGGVGVAFSTEPVLASEEESVCSDVDETSSAATPISPTDPDYICGFPPVTPYIGTSPTLCYLEKTKRPLCCLQLAQACEHCAHKQAKDYEWTNRSVIVAADHASNGLYNFIVPLRSHSRPKGSLNPIVLLLEESPDQNFLETICYFPMVYWMLGSIDSLDHLLRAGINLADNIVVVNKESSNAGGEDTLADCNTIVGVQTIFRLFPSANIITELSQANNMRFMQFRARDHYALQLSRLEKKEKESGSHLYYMFRLPFAAGNVFSASMLDTLLYQAFVKDYLITFVRLLLGVDQAAGSGHLACMKLTAEDMWIRTYGRLYQKLGGTTGEIPIGIYRTRTNLPTSQSVEVFEEHSYFDTCVGDAREIENMVKCRMSSLGLPLDEYKDDYNDVSSILLAGVYLLFEIALGGLIDTRDTVSYVIINPSYDIPLEIGDFVYLIRSSSLSPHLSRLMNETTHKRGRRKRYRSNINATSNHELRPTAIVGRQQPPTDAGDAT